MHQTETIQVAGAEFHANGESDRSRISDPDLVRSANGPRRCGSRSRTTRLFTSKPATSDKLPCSPLTEHHKREIQPPHGSFGMFDTDFSLESCRKYSKASRLRRSVAAAWQTAGKNSFRRRLDTHVRCRTPALMITDLPGVR
jgi:hypothetical protein